MTNHAPASAPNDPSAGVTTPRLTIEPARGRSDEEIRISLAGFPPGRTVMLRASFPDDAGKAWISWAGFVVDDEGRVEVGERLPIAGTYDVVDGSGLLWSARPGPGTPDDAPFEPSLAAPTTVTIQAEVDDRVVASAQCARLAVAPGVERRPVRERGLVGVLYQPAKPATGPGIIVLGGSSGGLAFAEETAAALAGRGYVCLALAYFGAEGLPAQLVNIPLEYFADGIDWLRAQARVRADRLAVVGRSRGAELALLLGATFPEISAVVAFSPSSILWSGLRHQRWGAQQGVVGVNEPAWAHQGVGLPFVFPMPSPLQLAAIVGRRPAALAPLFDLGLEDRAAAEAAAIPVERLRGAVLLVSGRDDRLWPSTRMAEAVMARLTEHRHPYPAAHLAYDHAGHLFRVPSWPTSVRRTPGLDFGGTTAGQAVANRDAWDRVLTFLRENLGK